MAQISMVPKISLKNEKINSQFRVSSKSLLETQKSVVNINKLLTNRIKVRKDIFSKTIETKRRREFDTRRQELEDEREARGSVVSGAVGNITSTVSKVGGSILGRLVRALGFITAGWILKSLPTWIGYAKEFIARVNELGRIIRSFITNVGNIFQSTGNILKAAKDNILKLDFFDSERNLRNSFSELGSSIEGLQKDFQDTIDVFTTDITKQIDGVQVGSYSGEAIPQPGTGFTEDATTPPTTYDSSGSYTSGKVPERVKSDTAFTKGVTELAKKYNVPEDYLYAVMGFETGGTFNPAEKNKAGSGATGLIQFMPSTARGLGTSTDQLSKMSRAEQLKYVDKYFSGKGIEGGSLSDVYMAVLFPAAVGKPDNFVLFGKGAMSGYTGIAYTQNKGLDLNGDGSVTKAEAASKVKNYLPKDFKATETSKASKVSPQIPSLPSGTGKAIFGETGNVRNAPNWVHGHFQTNTGTADDLVNDTAPIVKGLIDSGITPELSRGQKFTKNMTMNEIKQLIRVGINQHTHSGDGRSVDIFVPKGTKVPFPLYDVRNTGGRGGITAILPGSGKVWVGHLDPRSKSGGEMPTSQEKQTLTKPSPSTPAAQISSAPTQQKQQAVAQQITPERKPQDIVAVVPPPQQPQQSTASSGGSSQRSSGPSMGELLNNFMKQKFLLDLSFL